MKENESFQHDSSIEKNENDALDKKKLLNSRIKELIKLGTDVRRDLQAYAHEQIEGINISVIHNEIVKLIIFLEKPTLDFEIKKNTFEELEELIIKCETWLNEKEANN